MPRKIKENEPQVLGLLGVGLDNTDGHKRLTQCEEFLVVGGSEETHEMMQDVAIRFTEKLNDRGKRLQDTSLQEVVDILHKAIDAKLVVSCQLSVVRKDADRGCVS